MATASNSPSTHLPGETRSPLALRIGFWICVAIAIAVVIRRMVALAVSVHNGPPQLAALDDVFASHAALTLSHIIPALLFVLLAPFAVFARFARLQWPDRILFPLGAVVGITAYAMSAYAVGGWTERSAVWFFNSFFLFSLARAWWYRLHDELLLKRRWMLRAIAILLGIATTRPVMGVFFATSAVTHLVPSQFFGIAFWIGFSINVLVFELWLRSLDRRFQGRRSPSQTVISE
ncbi:MAG TPA: DUF2306 domain-containing protein [Terracidiphilus sp.]|jgi:hypothetical protein|nr:DUF2306 domain-containing protein [Terracidiphilus sp.]